jgi:hypothetical protein
MKKIIRCITLMLAISFSLIAAPNPKGMIIRNTDTLYATFIIPVTGPNFVMLQEGVRYLDSLNNECRINPGDAKEFRFEHKGKLIRMVSQFNNNSFDPDSGTTKFRHIVIDGPIKLFNYYTAGGYGGTHNGGPGYQATNSTYAGGTGNQSKKYKLQKGPGELISYDNMHFKNDMPIFLEKCPDLVKMIQDKVYRRADIEQIVNYYNSNCGNN